MALKIEDAIGKTITVVEDGKEKQVLVTEIHHSFAHGDCAEVNAQYLINYFVLFPQLTGEDVLTPEEIVESAKDFELERVPDPNVNRKERRARKKWFNRLKQ